MTWTRQKMTWHAPSAEFGAVFECSCGRQDVHLDVPCDIRCVLADILGDTVVFAETSVLTRAMSISTFSRANLMSQLIPCLIWPCQCRCRHQHRV